MEITSVKGYISAFSQTRKIHIKIKITAQTHFTDIFLSMKHNCVQVYYKS